MIMYLVFSAFTSRPISSLAATKASVFFFIVCTLLPNILTSSAWSPIVWTRKLTYTFLISVQLEAHSSSWRLTRTLRTTIYPSDFCRCILSIFYYTKVVFSPPPILTFLSSTIDVAVWLKTQGLCTLLQLASNCLVDSARRQTETRASYRYQQRFCCLQHRSGRIRQQRFCCRNIKVSSALALI